MIINRDISFFVIEDEPIYVMATLHKFFIDKNRARLLLSILPKYMNYFRQLDDFTIEMKYILSGNIRDYQNGSLVARITNCKIKQKWFDNMVIQHMEWADRIDLYCYIIGEIEFIDWDLLDGN